MVVVYRTSACHHLALDNVMKTQCGRHLATMDMVQIMIEGITEQQYRALHKLRPFCKTCIKTDTWGMLSWRLDT